jgi:glutamate-ammonia-ligase adenylyltransferase
MPDVRPLSSQIKFAPEPADATAAARAVEGWEASAPGRALLEGVAGCSPYLGRLIARYPEMARAALSSSPEENLRRVVVSAWKASDEGDGPAQMKALRRSKADAALSFALAEISGASTTMEAAAALSHYADAAVGAATRMALRQSARLGFRAHDEARPEIGCGVALLAMGKHGAFELNYSSDVDLVILYDGASDALGGPDNAKRVAVAVARAVVSRLNDQTADGYVFRTDLRLRPDPGVSAAAVSINAAETYYESYGQNWERAAFIKARAAAGDAPLGDEFINRLRPFIWRKYLDFAAIEEVHSVMRQIHAAKGAGDFDFFGHDLKRGRGGIREIEFYVQAQQLIHGGKNPAFRARATLDAMAALAGAGLIEQETAAALAERYRYLRKVEHRLQMIADEQTHRLPQTEAEARRLSIFLGEPSLDAFQARLGDVFRSTHKLTSPLFQPEARAAAKIGPLTFTGVDYDPLTVATLKALGFERPEQVADSMRSWQAGQTRATRTPRARALLTKIAPSLIEALSRAGAPDEAFAAFDGFLRSLPAGVQIFSLLLNRPDVFDNLIRIMTLSPFLAREIARRAYLAEALIESHWPDPTLTAEALAEDLGVRLAAADDYEAVLNGARRWASEESLAVSAQLLLELIGPDEAATRFTRIAETSLRALLAAATAETERQFGRIDGALGVMALGGLGAGAMTAASDVDLMFVYEAREGARATGASALDAVTYYARLVRRFLAAVTTPTEDGSLYDVDMQLRPSGAKGPAAISLASFEHYYANEAWTWEKMALTRARPFAGDAALGLRLAAVVDRVLEAPRDPANTASDIEDMRQRLRAAKPARGPWDLKNAVGGFVEVDFTLQYLMLTHASPMDAETRRSRPAAIGIFRDAGRLSASAADVLGRAHVVYEAVNQMSRAATGGVFAPGASGEAVKRLMAALLGSAAIKDAETALISLEEASRSVYEEIVASVAASERAD